MDIYFMVCLMRDGKERNMNEKRNFVYSVGTRWDTDVKIKKIGGKRACLNTNRSVSHQDLITSHLQYLLKGRWHQLE